MSVIESVEKNSIIFGPIHSRRFGVSLGIDLSPSQKQCNFDCLYCELSPAKVIDKQEKVIEVDAIIDALKTHLNDTIDVITLTANGEPTLYPYLDELIDKIKSITNKEILILTNSATLKDKKVFNALLKLDQVKLSLDAATQEVFKKIDRATSTIHVDEIIEAISLFSKLYSGKLMIEILFVKNINDKPQEIVKLNEALLKFSNIYRVDIGTIDRPPAYKVDSLSFEELHKISLAFDATLPIHIATRKATKDAKSFYSQEDIVNTLLKRPLTQDDIEHLFDEKSQENFKQLLQKGVIKEQKMGNILFFVVKSKK